jgi:hypothetical protein
MTRNQKIALGVEAAAVVIVLALLGASLFNSYKESQFAARQAELQRQLDEQKINAKVQEELANKAAEAGRQKDVEIQQLKTDNEALAKTADEKRIVYVESRKPVPVRPYNGNVTDADIRAAAGRAGLVIRDAP